MLKQLKIPCLQTIEELKAKCKRMNIRIVPYNYEKHYKEFNIKRDREEEKDEYQVKRLKTYPKLNNKNGLMRLQNSKRTNGKLLINSLIENEEEINRNGLNGLNGVKNDHQYGKLNGTQTKCDFYINDNLDKIVLQSLENFKNLEKTFDFYNQLNSYAKELNSSLVKFNNKPVIVQNKVDQDLPPKFAYINSYKLDNLDAETLKLIKDNVQQCKFLFFFKIFNELISF